MRVEYSSDPVMAGDVDSPHIILSDHGCHMMLGADKVQTSYNGVNFLDPSYDLIKSLFDIRSDRPVERVVVGEESTMRYSSDLSERFFWHDRIWCWQAKGAAIVDVLFDIRDAYDSGEFGREHSLVEKVIPGDARCFIVSAKGLSFAVLVEGVCSPRDSWLACPTAFDERRGGPSEWWAWHGLSLNVSSTSRITICPPDRLSEARQVLDNKALWRHEVGPIGDDPVHALCWRSLSGLSVHTPGGQPGILAGLPWFFQIYTRDEAIAVGALIVKGDFHRAGRILLREVGLVLDNGLVPNRFPASGTGSADGVGWSFLRLSQLLEAAPHALSPDQWSFVYSQLKLSLSRLREDGGLVWNDSQETWMDTTGGTDDDRCGVRIEIQALTLRMLSLAERLAADIDHSSVQDWRVEKESFRAVIRDRFFHGGSLWDGRDDATIRPNALLCRYIIPSLLSDDEWRAVFNGAMPQLLLDWGGLSSIDKDHPLYRPLYSGADDRSYHRGDSWYFMNNLVACAMAGLGGDLLEIARSIYASSVDDLLWKGALGHSSEVSSAEHQEALGCLSQAWSVSSLIELRHSLERASSRSS